MALLDFLKQHFNKDIPRNLGEGLEFFLRNEEKYCFTFSCYTCPFRLGVQQSSCVSIVWGLSWLWLPPPTPASSRLHSHPTQWRSGPRPPHLSGLGPHVPLVLAVPLMHLTFSHECTSGPLKLLPVHCHSHSHIQEQINRSLRFNTSCWLFISSITAQGFSLLEFLLIVLSFL